MGMNRQRAPGLKHCTLVRNADEWAFVRYGVASRISSWSLVVQHRARGDSRPRLSGGRSSAVWPGEDTGELCSPDSRGRLSPRVSCAVKLPGEACEVARTARLTSPPQSATILAFKSSRSRSAAVLRLSFGSHLCIMRSLCWSCPPTPAPRRWPSCCAGFTFLRASPGWTALLLQPGQRALH
jgi:hypothetical protein